jgi:head-tail adaptor
MRAGELNRQVTILRRIVTKDPIYNTDIIVWEPVKTVYAKITEVLPARGEEISSEISLASKPAKVVMRWRDDIDQSSRVQIDGKQMRIIAGPAMIGLKVGLEIVVQEFSTEGQEL